MLFTFSGLGSSEGRNCIIYYCNFIFYFPLNIIILVYPTIRGTKWLCIILALRQRRMYRLNPKQVQLIVKQPLIVFELRGAPG